MRNENFIKEVQIIKSRIDPDSYLARIPWIWNSTGISFSHRVTILTGENGSGKSTLLEGIAAAYGLNLSGGTKNFLPDSLPVSAPLSSALLLHRGVKRPEDSFFLRAESFYHVATQIDAYEKEQSGYLRYYGGKSLNEQSHGESFLSLAQNRFSPKSFYLLDEPEAALSPQRQLTLLLIIKQLSDAGTQFILSTHSPILAGIPDAGLLALDDSGIRQIPYEEAECVQVMKMFLTQKDKMLKELCDV